MYDTGDLVCYSSARGLQFIGRADRQIKFRGFRIELEDVEKSLLAIGGVRQLVCIQSSPSLLTAFYTTEAQTALDSRILEQEARARLPSFVQPLQFIWMAALPLSTSGKVDLRKLTEHAAEAAIPTVDPGIDGHLDLITEVWCEVLGIDSCRADVNFFDAGGTSLSLFRLHELLSARIPSALSLVDLYSNPTIGALAGLLRQQGRSEPERAAGHSSLRRRRRERQLHRRERRD
jgi:hypothetical protein